MPKPSGGRTSANLAEQPGDFSLSFLGERTFKNHWNAFMVQPEDLDYEALLQGEKILLFVRQHPIVNVSWILLVVVMLIAPFVLFPFFHQHTKPHDVQMNS
jgi:hypothetical protein